MTATASDTAGPRASALLAAVIANPADDTVRLVYADYLEGTGEHDRAEFIRLQVELAKWEAFPGERFDGMTVEGKRYDFVPTAALIRREQELWRGGLDVAYHKSFCDLIPGSVTTTIDPNWNPTGHARILVRRGFAFEVHCPLAAWVGGRACEACAAGLSVEMGYDHGPYADPCPACGGTGRTPALGPALVRAHPVERVVLTDREPYYANNVFYWSRDTWGNGSDTLPDDLYQRMRDLGLSSNGESMRGFPTRDDALSALSAACLAWAAVSPVPA